MTGASTAFEGMLADRLLKQIDESSFVVDDGSGTLSAYIGLSVETAMAAAGRAVVLTTVARPSRLAGAQNAADLVRTMIEAHPANLIRSAIPSLIGTAPMSRAFETSHSFAMIQNHLASMGSFAVSNAALQPTAVNWLIEGQVTLLDLLSGLDGEPSAKEWLYALGVKVLLACAGSQEPAIDLDPEGNLEFYFKEQAEGLLLVVKGDGALHIFGNSSGESWRSLYPLSGHIWRHRLQVYLAPFKQHA
jgi:hypothetical protein